MNPRTTRLLLTVIGIDTLRNIAENTYFGLYFGGKYGVFPAWTVDLLGRPELLILPKLCNVLAGCVVLGLLLFIWLPAAVVLTFAVIERFDAFGMHEAMERRSEQAALRIVSRPSSPRAGCSTATALRPCSTTGRNRSFRSSMGR